MITKLALFAVISFLPGVPNFHRVNDDLYRGGQPSQKGFAALARAGIKTVVDLRIPDHQSNWEKKVVEAVGMRYIHIPLHGGETPTQADIDRTFKILLDTAQWPVFVHCREGKDRTGMIIACYRISHDGWTNARALAEAKSYAIREIKPAMADYIKKYHAERQNMPNPGEAGGGHSPE